MVIVTYTRNCSPLNIVLEIICLYAICHFVILCRVFREEDDPHLAFKIEREEDTWAYMKNVKKIWRAIQKACLELFLDYGVAVAMLA